MEPELTYRAEQAYLGALLARHDRSNPRTATFTSRNGPSGLMSARDFADPVHQAIFAAIARQPGSARQDDPAGWAGRIRDLLQRVFSPQARRAAAYMARLPGLCPDPAHGPFYAAMIAEASQHRADQAHARLAGLAPREFPVLDQAGAWLDDQAPAQRRASRQGPRQSADEARPVTRPVLPPQAQASAAPSPQAQELTVPSPRADAVVAGLSPETARLARALRADARRATQASQDHHPEQEGSASDLLAQQAAGADGGPRSATPEDLQARVLASLMHHPAQGRAVVKWLPAEAFSDAPLRDLYDLIRQRIASDRPVDPLVIAWDASTITAPSPAAAEYGGAAFLTQTALRVGALDPGGPDAAHAVGRALWADTILTKALGEDWPGNPERIRLLAARAAENPAQQSRPAPAATRSAAPAAQEKPVQQPVAGSAPRQRKQERTATDHAGPVPAAKAQDAQPAPAPPRQARPTPPRPVKVQQQPPAPAPGGPAQRM